LRAVELLDTISPDDASHRLRLLLGLGEARNLASLDTEARPVFLEAAQVARRIGDAAGLAWAALGFSSERTAFTPEAEEVELLHEALRAVEGDEPLLRGRLLARLASVQYFAVTPDETLALANEAVTLAERTDDPVGRLHALYAKAFGCWTPDRTPELLVVSERYLDEAILAGDPYHELLAHRWLACVVTELGDVARGGLEATRAIEIADDLQLSAHQWVSRLMAASHQLVAGDLELAEQLATDGLALGSLAEPEAALDYVSIFMWTLRWLQGRLDAIAGMVEEVAAGPGVDLARRMGLAVTRAELGRVDDAATLLDGVTVRELDELRKDVSWYITMAALAEAAAATGHQRTAALAFERLQPYHERIAITSVNATGPVAHHVGIAAWTAGHHDLGRRALADAIEIADAAGAPVFGARSRLALAERLALLGDLRRSSTLAHAAQQAAMELGLVGVEQRAALVVAAS
jgi:hypothetical protein